jgi:hypothetical protein
VHHDYKTALAAEVVDEQLEKGVEDKGLIYVAQRVDPEGMAYD